MLEPVCPDCGNSLRLIDDLEEKVYRCVLCRCEYDEADLMNQEDNLWNSGEPMDFYE